MRLTTPENVSSPENTQKVMDDLVASPGDAEVRLQTTLDWLITRHGMPRVKALELLGLSK